MSKTANVRPKRAVRRPDANDGRAAAPIDLGVLPNLVGYMLRRAQLAVFQDFWRVYEAYDIRPAQYAVLIVIDRNPGLRQSQVSAALNIKRANLVALLDSLEQRGLAKRVPVATDRRSYALHLTEDGAALLKKLGELSAAHEQRVSATIGESGRKELLRLLHGVVQAVGSSAPDDDES
ncbi:MAG: MarR family transcriptional regulator [Bradyrhizobiaceae bacterium]|nr:MarR family transcriptional regulator [Bradyrhizobiaceae bacterium]